MVRAKFNAEDINLKTIISETKTFKSMEECKEGMNTFANECDKKFGKELYCDGGNDWLDVVYENGTHLSCTAKEI